MTTTFGNEYNALSPFVALIQQIVDGTISESGVGAVSFATLQDKSTVNLPVLNGPLAVVLAALADKATAMAHYTSTSNPHSVTATQIGAIASGSLSTINGTSLQSGGNIVVGGATPVNDLTTGGTTVPLSAQQGVSLKTLVDSKAPTLANVDLGTGTIALTATANANRANRAAPTVAQTVTIDTTGGTIGDVYPLADNGTANITMPGGMVIQPGYAGAVEWQGGSTFARWDTPAATGGSAVPITVTGSTVNGSVLTRTLAAGWTETGGNWARDGTNISGATSPTYTTVSADGTHTVTWKSTSIPFVPTGIAVAAPTGPTYASAVLADSPLVYWKLDELSGTTVADSSGNARDGTLTGTYSLNQSPVFAGSTKAISFNGGGARLAASPLSADPYNGSFTLECCFKVSSLQDAMILCLGGGSSQCARIYCGSDGSIGADIHTAAPNYFVPTSATGLIVAGIAHHAAFVVTRAGANWSSVLYLDGTSVATSSDTDANTLVSISPGVCVGSGGTNTENPFNGIVDEVAVYGTALSLTQVGVHYGARAS